MFAVLQLERGRHRGLLDRLLPSRLIREPREVMGGRYLLLRWVGPALPDWGKIEAACSRFPSRLLFPEGLRPPPAEPLAMPGLPRFGRRVLLETACAIAMRSRLPMYRRILGLADPDADLTELLPPLLRYYSCVKVATNETGLYAEVSGRVMRELGAPVLVGRETDTLDDCCLILTAEASHLPRPPRAPVFCLNGFSGGFPCVTAPEITPPAEILAACPPGISPHLFAGALAEFSGLEAMRFTATSMLCDYRRTDLAGAVGAMLTRIACDRGFYPK